jgi:hypothetical protein
MPDKISYIILPYIQETDSFERCKVIIGKLRTVDEGIELKIKCLKIDYPKTHGVAVSYRECSYIECNDELNRIKIKLRHSRSLLTGSSIEQDEYDYVKLMNVDKGVRSKEEYFTKNNYISEPEAYFITRRVWTHWYDFIGVDTSKYIKTKEEWYKKCKEYNISSYDMYLKKCNDCGDTLPFDPEYFYPGFCNISKELGFKVRR